MAKLYDLNGQPQTDRWQRLADDRPLPTDAAGLIIPLARWQAEREALRGYAGGIGLALDNTADIDAIAADLDAFGLIVLSFPVFSDGRAFSQAAALRSRLGFAGALRASGDIQPDQLHYLRRCGFSEFEFATEPGADLRARLHAFSRSYQPAPGDAPALTAD